MTVMLVIFIFGLFKYAVNSSYNTAAGGSGGNEGSSSGASEC
jgi:hypothetical protein